MKWLFTFALVLGSTLAHADSGRRTIPDHPLWKAECGSCHVAYPPQLLTPENWQQLMGKLDKHFGANAALSPNDARAILDFLQRHAGTGTRNSATSLRISDTPWFTREHRKISQSNWLDPAIKSRSNCTACHVNAERGDWSEHGIRIPGGRKWEEHEERSEDAKQAPREQAPEDKRGKARRLA